MAERICSIDDCDRPPYARGWCRRHYLRWWRGTRVGDRTCAVEGCERTDGMSRGWCSMHYKRWRANGHVRSNRDFSEAERFWKRVRKTKTCWVWIAGITGAGYGVFSGAKDDRSRLAHRWAWQWLVGPIPVGMAIDHLCRNPSCVNPAHLEVVTPLENNVRSMSPSARNAKKTHCINGHEFTPENTHVRKSGRRECRTCMRERMRTRRANHIGEMVGQVSIP